MMRILFTILAVFSVFNLSSQDTSWFKTYSSRWENFDGGTKMIANNDNYLPITFVLNYKPVNLKADKPNGTYVIVPPRTKDFVVVSFNIINTSKRWEFKKGGAKTFLGDLTDTDYDENYIYDLPFSTNESFKIGQGYNGNVTHQDKFALDFDMPINTKVFASRDGIVVKVVKTNSKSCGEQKCAKFNNLIKILHDDGTIMQYLHFRKNGVKVREGQKVKKGEHIGFSGNTGWSTGPHLHIELYLVDKNNKMKTLKTRFKINENDIAMELIEDEVYVKKY